MLPDTASVPVAMIFDPVRLPVKYPLPTTEKLVNGEVVEIPMLPLVEMKREEVPIALFVPEKYATCPVVPESRNDVEFVRQLPPIEKHPVARLIPPVVEKVDVAVEKLIPFVSPTERSEPGDVVPIPTFAIV